MLVILKSPPGTSEGRRGVRMARELAADLVFLEDGVYYARKGILEGFCGMAYMLQEDGRARGIAPEEIEKEIKVITYAELISLIETEERTIGVF
jgi:sulfur relay protein TusB/DsrH